jgi:hypothetical protein
MRYLKLSLIIFSYIFFGQAFAETGRSLWMKSSIDGKVKVLEAYKSFLVTYERVNTPKVSFIEKNSSSYFFNYAWADEVLNCLYAGWPSVLVGGKCTSPTKNNSGYDQGSCGANTMQCQPLLFGNNLCAPTGTSQERQLAFSNCNKKFKESGASPAAVVKDIIKNKEEKKLLELLDLADKICKKGAQASTGMCKVLLAHLEEVNKATLEEGTKFVVSGLKEVNKVALVAGKNPKADCQSCGEAKSEGKVNRAPAFVGEPEIEPKKETIVAKKLTPPAAPPEPPTITNKSFAKPDSMKSFERVTARIPVACGGARTDADGIDVMHEMDCSTNAEYPGGYSFRNNPGHPYLDGAKSPYPDGGTPSRNVEFVSRDNASNETYLYLEDVAGGPDSHDVKSVMYLLPRLGVPTTEVSGDDVIVTMTTGEKVIFDKKTHAIKSGALKEGPIDLTTDRFKRTPPNVQYTGEGISIRVNHRFNYPTMPDGASTAEVRQGTRVCQVPRGKIWDSEGALLSNDDKTFVDVINKSCPPKAGEVAFHI